MLEIPRLELLILFAMATGLPSCSQTRNAILVAHRGASHAAPENTVSSVKLAWEEGADAAEVDVRLTSDGKVLCCHDDSTGRTGNRDFVIAATPYRKLRSLDAGSWKSPRYAGEPFPLLDDVLAAVPPGKFILVEIKCGVEILPALETVIEKSGLLAKQVVFISFNAEVVAACRKRFPEHKAFWLTGFKKQPGGEIRPGTDEILASLEKTGASGLDCQAHDSVGRSLVRRLRKHGYEFHTWTVDDPAVARRFLRLGVDSITTNRPAWLRQQLPSEATPPRSGAPNGTNPESLPPL